MKAARLPGPKSAVLAYAELFRNPLRYLESARRRYGDVVHMQLGRRHDFLLNHPDYVRAVLLDQDNLRRSVPRPVQRLLGQGLLTSRGTIHKKQKALLQPAFSRQHISSLAPIMVREIVAGRDRWSDGTRIEMASEMARLALAIAGRTLFNVDFAEKATDLRESLVTVLEATRFNNLLLASKHLERFPSPGNREVARATRTLDRLIRELIAERRAGPCDQPDLLSQLVLLSKQARKGMNDEKIRDQILTFFLGGHETIASGLMWTWYLLAQNPGAEKKMHAEIDRVTGDELPSVETLERLPYTRMVFSESMRLYPPIWILGRRATREVTLNGLTVPKDSYVHISQYLVQRDPRFFPDPERFDPERWTPEAVAARPRFSYFPFGAGLLHCIGEGYAWMQAGLVLSILARRWQPRLLRGHQVRLEPQLTLKARRGLPMTLRRRR